MSETALTVTAPTALAVLTDGAKFDAFYERIKAEAATLKPDLTTERGRKAIASMAYKVAQTKTAIDAEGKRLTEEWRDKVKTVDAARKVIRDRLDVLRDEVRAPLTDWEANEADRVNRVDAALAALRLATTVDIDDTSETVLMRMEALQATVIDEAVFQSHYTIAVNLYDAALVALDGAHKRLLKAEADRAELDALRAANAEREERERIAAENEATLRAIMGGVRHIADYVMEESVRVEAEAHALAQAIANAERDAAEAATRAAEKAAADALAEQQRAADEALAAEKRRADELAAQAKKEADAKAAEARAQAARDADRKHRGEVMKAAKEAVMLIGASEETAKKIVLAIMAGEIPNVRLTF